MSDAPVLRGEYQHTKRRRERLIELVELGHGTGNVQALAAELDVSVSTVRRDLAQLDAEGKIARTYGGAIGTARLDRSWHDKLTENQALKRTIAAHAVKKVRPGNNVLLDSGTTVAEAATMLGTRGDVQLTTNGLSSVVALADTNAEVTVLGGRLRRPSESIVGAATLLALQHLTADIAFLGAEALDPQRGLNCPEMDQALVKELMMRNGREAWVLIDSSKLERESRFAYWAPLRKGLGLITDDQVEPELLDSYREAGWQVEIAPGR